MNKKAELTITTFFYFLMALLFIWIMVFGYTQISNTQSVLSELELVKLKNELRDAMHFCNEPLNSGSSTFINIQHKSFNSICILQKDYSGPNSDWAKIKSTGDNVVLLKTLFDNTGSVIEKHVISTFQLDFEIEGDREMCWYDINNTGRISRKIECR